MLLSENRAIPDGLVKHSGESMGDEQSDLKKRSWILAGVCAGIAIFGQCVRDWPAFSGQGFNPFRWETFLVGAFGAVVARICFGLLGQRKVTTTLGIGEAKARKLQ